MRTPRARRSIPAFRTFFALALASASLCQLSNAAPAPGADNPSANAAGATVNDAAKQRRRERAGRERERRSANLRRVMGSMGISDRALQDEVLRHIAQETRARAQLRRKGSEIYSALRDPARSDDEMRALLAQYQSLVQSDRARRRAAEDALNERISFRSKPRLEAMLTLFGVIGDAPLVLPAGARRG